MADAAISALNEGNGIQAGDYLAVDRSGVSYKAKPAGVDGWIDSTSETWTYASADGPTFTFTVSGDQTGKYTPGTRIKLTQTTVKYFIVTAVSVASGTTTVTVYGGTDYTLANSAITANYYARVKAPAGFPLNPTKWTESASVTTNTNLVPTNGTWYNLASLQLAVPIGAWKLGYKSINQVSAGSTASDIYVTLSTANNSESDKDFTSWTFLASAVALVASHSADKRIALTAKTTYYLLAKQDQSSGTLYVRGDVANAQIKAVCAYL